MPWITSPVLEDEQTLDTATPGRGTKGITTQISSVDQVHKIRDVPVFKHYDENHTIELFYDLWYVANLSNFQSINGIENASTMANYIGFFTILWFTWLQTTIFDIRFGVDSVFDRVCKAVTFGVMAAYAMAGALYNTDKVEENLKGFRMMSLILMASRLMLLIQYATVLWYTRKYKQTKLPLLLTMAALLMSTGIFIGTFYAYDGDDKQHVHMAFYFVSLVETACILLVSMIWRVVSFKHTRLIPRIGDLTLIMIGEGIIGMVQSISRVMQNSPHVSDSIGMTMAGVLLTYFVWMLYFDQIDHSRFGTIRQQFWALFHYPVHLAIVFIMEGNRELQAYHTIVGIESRLLHSIPPEADEDLNIDFVYWTCDFSAFNSVAEVVDSLNSTLESFNGWIKNSKLENEFNSTQFFEIFAGNTEHEFNTPEWTIQASNLVGFFSMSLNSYLLTHFGVTPANSNYSDVLLQTGHEDELGPLLESYASLSPMEQKMELAAYNYFSLYTVFDTVFLYFPVGAGVFLLLLAMLFMFGRRNKSGWEWGSIVLRLCGGTGLIGVAGWHFSTRNDTDNTYYKFSDSGWMIPMVMLTLFIVIVGDHLMIWAQNRGVVDKTADGVTVTMGPGADKAGGYQSVPSRGGEVPDADYHAGEAYRMEQFRTTYGGQSVPYGLQGTPYGQGTGYVSQA